MIDGLEARVGSLAARRVKAIRDAAAEAELPPGFTSERADDAVVIQGPDLVRRLAFDPRMLAIGLIWGSV